MLSPNRHHSQGSLSRTIRWLYEGVVLHKVYSFAVCLCVICRSADAHLPLFAGYRTAFAVKTTSPRASLVLVPVSQKYPAETYKGLTPNKNALLRAQAGLASGAAASGAAAAQLPGGGELATFDVTLSVLAPGQLTQQLNCTGPTSACAAQADTSGRVYAH